MKKNYLALAIGIIGLISCKKENFDIPPNSSISENPIFLVEGQIGEESLSLAAGVDGAALETSTLTVNGINYFTGAMVKGQQSLSLSVSDGQIGLNPSLFDAFPSNIPFSYSSISWYEMNANTLPNIQQIQSISFSVDGTTVGNQFELFSPGFHTICADIAFFDGTNKSICNQLLLGYEDFGAFSIKTSNQSGSAPTSLWTESSAAVSEIHWYVNDQFYSNSQQFQLNQGQGVLTVKAKVTFSNGLTREHTVLVDTDGENRNFSDMEMYKTPVANELFNDFKIMLTYQNGTEIYTSHSTVDNPSYFVVGSISIFKQLPNGNKIYKVSGTINTQLMNVLSGILLPSQLNVVFAVELPY